MDVQGSTRNPAGKNANMLHKHICENKKKLLNSINIKARSYILAILERN